MPDVVLNLLGKSDLLIVFIGMAILLWKNQSALQTALLDVTKLLAGQPLAPPAAPVPGIPAPAPAPVPPPPTAAPAVPAWFTWAQHEVGFHETGSNGGIDKYIALGHCGANGDPWCAIFANAALEACGVPGTRSPSSQSFRSNPNFIQLQTPRQGALAVFWRGAKDSGLGHVGFYVSDNATTVRTLGGNENDAVRIEDLPKDSASFGLIGYWWPKSIPLTGVGPVALPPPAAAVPSTAPAHQSNIIATMFGGPKSAYGPAIDDTRPGVALPFRFSGERPRVRVTNRVGIAIDCDIVDVGPWNINDPYWQTGARPQAESGTDMTGRHTNGAGIDLTLAAAKALAIDGKGVVSWEFIASPLSPPTVT